MDGFENSDLAKKPPVRDPLKIYLVAIFVGVEAFKFFLTFRHFLFLTSLTREKVPELNMSESEFNKHKKLRKIEVLHMLINHFIQLTTCVAKLTTNYYPSIWKATRAVVFSALRADLFLGCDMLLTHSIFIPLVFVVAFFSGDYLLAAKINPYQPSFTSIVEVCVTVLGLLSVAVWSFNVVLITYLFSPTYIVAWFMIKKILSYPLNGLYMALVVPIWYSKNLPLKGGDVVYNLASSLEFPKKRIYVDKWARTKTLYQVRYDNRVISHGLFITESMFTMEKTELESLVAHELGHWYYGHTYFFVFIDHVEFVIRGILWTLAYGNLRLVSLFGLDPKTHPCIPGYLMSFLIWPEIRDVLRGLANLIACQFEYAADDFASLCGSVPKLISGLQRLSSEKYSLPFVDTYASAWFYGRPPLYARIRRIMQLTQKRSDLPPSDDSQPPSSAKRPSTLTLPQTNQKVNKPEQ